MNTLRPRQYAFGTVDPKTGERLTPGIANLKTREERMKALGAVPDEFRSWVEALVKDAYTGSLGPAATGFRLEAIVVDNGLIMLSGRTK